MDRLTSGPAGSYTYGDSAHLHAATSTSGGYTGTYDAAGDLTCRAPSSSTTCTGTVTGAPLTYDNEGRLTHWQSAPSSPTTSADYAYDGEGERVAQKVTTGSTSATTYYVAGLEEIAGGVVTKYLGGMAMRVGATLSYLATDGLGSISASLNTAGTLTSAQLFAPYGTTRYSTGTSPTAKGFTGQYGDAATGLAYYHARYYDPTLGQFASADTVADGLNRYAYVHGNPTTATDPSGHRRCLDDVCGSSELTGHTGAPTVTTSGGGGGGGGSGGGSGGGCGTSCPQINGIDARCYTRPGDIDPSTCMNAWKELQRPLRHNSLIGRYVLAIGNIVVATAMVELADFFIARFAHVWRERALAILDMILTGINTLTLFSSAFPNQAHFFYQVLAGFHLAATAVHGVISVVDSWGAFGAFAVSAALDGAIEALSGVPGVFLSVAEAMIGVVALHARAALGHLGLSVAYRDYAEVVRQDNMDPAAWCQQYGQGVCTQPPPAQ